ncbi:menaquinone biosynthesis protein [uncultured Selenomonas sp.]|uniref:menaquinone biosynthetic enzyme MqnA/MqnD family protein n=1 Tax=uncultured Selenomonas sp. TaxID=159275 RepID=UPI0025D6D713|nr:menaquinone biosynthesis protein [uncultured Selenomonas sp.]
MQQKPRIGHIDFLNVLPLAYGYAHGGSGDAFDIRRGVPAVLNSDIAAGRLDISNVSSILYARHAEKLCVLPHVCVSSDGPVESILLVSKKPLEALEDDPIALTAKSATSHALLKIILRSGYGANPRYSVQNLSPEHPIPEDQTAALFIGDDALYLYWHASPQLYAYDLGAEWKKLTGKKMVYALWVATKDFAARSPEGLRRAAALIEESFAYGIAHKDAAIRSVLGEKPFLYHELDEYLGGVIRWDLSDEYLDGLRTFYALAERNGLIEKAPQIEFADV